jgi:hypothetical protein
MMTTGEIKYLWNMVDVKKENEISSEAYVDFKNVFIEPFEEFCNGAGLYTMDEAGLTDCITNDPNI